MSADPSPVHGESPLFVYGANHREAPVDIREQLSLSPEGQADFYRKIKEHPHTREFLLLSTCNRIEAYVVAEKSPRFTRQIVRQHLGALLHLPQNLLEEQLHYRNGLPTIQHLFAVAAGMDSLVVGEAEILGQVKAAYAEARQHNTIGPVLNRLFQKTFQAAKWVRTNTDIGRGQVSVGSVAVELSHHVFGDLRDCRILVIGAGEIDERTLTSLQSRGARQVTITNRTYSKACEAARIFHGQALPLEDLDQALAETDIVIGSTNAPQPLLSAARLRPLLHHRPLQPLFLIDLAVPRNFASDCADLEGVYLYNIDDLSDLAQRNLRAREKELAHCRQILHHRAQTLWPKLHLPPPRKS